MAGPEERETDRGTLVTVLQNGFLLGLVIASLAALWGVWVNVLPALKYLDNFEVGSTSVTTTETVTALDGTQEERTVTRQEPVTVADLLWALVIALLTITAARNLPGLLEVALLQRLPLEPSVRYAIRALTQYAIVLLGLFLGAILGTFHAVHQHRPAGYLLDLLSAVALSLPSLILGLAALMFASGTQWFPVGGMSSVSLESPHPFTWVLDRLHHLALPVACIGLPVAAVVEKIQWSAARNTLEQLHVRSAQARGLSRRSIFFMHVLLPSLNPVLSILGPLLGGVLSGSLVLETIFSWPGLGKATYDALFHTDIYLLLGCVACGGVLLALGNLGADLLLFLLDPRTRYFSKETL